MGNHHPPHDFDPRLAALIRRKASRLAGRLNDPAVDHDDVAQELALAVVAAGPEYDRTRAGPATFQDRVVRNKLVNIAIAASAAKRDRRRVEPLIDRDVPSTTPGAEDVQLDVRSALATLPVELCPVADALKTSKVAQAARHLGLTRGQVRYAVERIAIHFRAVGVSKEEFGAQQPLGPPTG